MRLDRKGLKQCFFIKKDLAKKTLLFYSKNSKTKAFAKHCKCFLTKKYNKELVFAEEYPPPLRYKLGFTRINFDNILINGDPLLFVVDDKLFEYS